MRCQLVLLAPPASLCDASCDCYLPVRCQLSLLAPCAMPAVTASSLCDASRATSLCNGSCDCQLPVRCQLSLLAPPAMPAGPTISLCDASCDCYHLIESLRQVTNWRKVVALLLSPCVIRAGVASAHAALHWQHVQHCTGIICMQHRTGSMCVCVQHRTGSMCVCAASYRQHLHPCILPSFSLHSPRILPSFSGLHVQAASACSILWASAACSII